MKWESLRIELKIHNKLVKVLKEKSTPLKLNFTNNGFKKHEINLFEMDNWLHNLRCPSSKYVILNREVIHNWLFDKKRID